MEHYFDFDIYTHNAAVAFGFFDGMHTGHRAVIDRLVSHESSVVISFAASEEVIYTETEKEYILEKLGVNNMITLQAEKYMTMPMDEFVREYLVHKLGAGAVVAGENYGKLDELKAACKKNGIALEIVAEISDEGEPVSADILKNVIKSGNMNRAFRLMGGSYVMAGPVVHGKGIAGKHGMPTANLKFADNKIWPEYGVYGTVVSIRDSSRKGITNIGLRPSVDDIPFPTCETYILDFDDYIYDMNIVLEAFLYIRPVIRFVNFDEVKKQVDRDIKKLKEISDNF